MDRESVERLRFDRRLARRRDWVQDNDLDQYVESLPDLTDKMTTAAELEAEAEAQAEAAPAPPATPPAAAPTPAAESFGGSTTFGGGSGGFGSDTGGSGSSF